MSTQFERFAKMAKEEFGLTVVKTTSQEQSTFESLFGVSSESIAQYELPYNISAEQFGYYDEMMPINGLENSLPTINFIADDNMALAA